MSDETPRRIAKVGFDAGPPPQPPLGFSQRRARRRKAPLTSLIDAQPSTLSSERGPLRHTLEAPAPHFELDMKPRELVSWLHDTVHRLTRERTP